MRDAGNLDCNIDRLVTRSTMAKIRGNGRVHMHESSQAKDAIGLEGKGSGAFVIHQFELRCREFGTCYVVLDAFYQAPVHLVPYTGIIARCAHISTEHDAKHRVEYLLSAESRPHIS